MIEQRDDLEIPEWAYYEWLAKAHHAIEHTTLNPDAIWRLHERHARRCYYTEDTTFDLGGEA